MGMWLCNRIFQRIIRILWINIQPLSLVVLSCFIELQLSVYFYNVDDAHLCFNVTASVIMLWPGSVSDVLGE